jgi:hypothetical protein
MLAALPELPNEYSFCNGEESDSIIPLLILIYVRVTVVAFYHLYN